ncbi:hypothetical protein C349_06270 [Cryptococcus neoformans var. grubii Br795]|nr:hypothetical protein C349_06270 [Cryptococcus neoformans var. grubii Br795]
MLVDNDIELIRILFDELTDYFQHVAPSIVPACLNERKREGSNTCKRGVNNVVKPDIQRRRRSQLRFGVMSEEGCTQTRSARSTVDSTVPDDVLGHGPQAPEDVSIAEETAGDVLAYEKDSDLNRFSKTTSMRRNG